MTQLQRLIKYAATALAIILIANIFFGIFTAIGAVGFLFDAFKGGGEASDEYDDSAEYMPEEDFSAENLKIDLKAANLVIKETDSISLTVSVSSSEKTMEVEEKNDTVYINEKDDNFDFLKHRTPQIVLYVPRGKVFKNIDIDAGAGKIEIDCLEADKIDFRLGAGLTMINRICSNEKSEIIGGTGKLEIKDGTLANLSLDIGIGSVKLKSKLVGSSRINYGIGNAKITLVGNIDDYKIDFDNNISRAYINGETAKSEIIYGSGENRITVNGGIGNVSIDFAENTNK